MFRRHSNHRFRRRYHRKHVFPFWIFAILFFVFMGKSGWWIWMFPFFLYWCFGPMFWTPFGPDKWDAGHKQEPLETPIPSQWQSPSHPKPAPKASEHSVKSSTVGQPMHSMADLPNACAACGGPVNKTTVEWRSNTPTCGYCGSTLK